MEPTKNNSSDLLNTQGEILHTISYGGGEYVVLKRDHDSIDDAYLYRRDNEQLVDIDDEQEWEHVAEMVDQYIFMQITRNAP